MFRNFEDSSVGTGRDTINATYVQGVDVIEFDGADVSDSIGTAAFSGAGGELRYEHDGGRTILMGDVDGDAAQDFEVEIDRVVNLTNGDFVFVFV